MRIRRRTALIGGLALLGGRATAAARKRVLPSGDMSMGSPNAPIQLVEYASLSCPHCARFNEQVFPAFKAKYIDTGQVRYTLREVLTPPAEVAAAGFLMARCAGPKRYFNVVDEVFRSQDRWGDDDLTPLLVEIAGHNGLSEKDFRACINDPLGLTALNSRIKAATASGVSSTPTFFVNGRKVAEGEVTLADLQKAIAAARRRGG